jgi:hypothetical protein
MRGYFVFRVVKYVCLLSMWVYLWATQIPVDGVIWILFIVLSAGIFGDDLFS